MRRRRPGLSTIVVAGTLGLACAAARAVTPSEAANGAAGGPSVLFIGNSLTASNELAARVAAIAAAAGRPLRTSAVTISGASLLDHWQDGRARQAIRDGRWDVVAMQQGPSTLPESRAELIASTRQFAAEVRAVGGRPALLMVWPLPGQAAAAVSASYRAAAEANDALLLPAGDAWTRARQTDAALVLTQDDGFHPSLLGTWLAALTVECTLFPQDRAALRSVAAPSGLGLDARRRDLLVEAACGAAAVAGGG
jgi:hypothetical protein